MCQKSSKDSFLGAVCDTNCLQVFQYIIIISIFFVSYKDKPTKIIKASMYTQVLIK